MELASHPQFLSRPSRLFFLSQLLLFSNEFFFVVLIRSSFLSFGRRCCERNVAVIRETIRSVMFWAGPGSEADVIEAASAYEAATTTAFRLLRSARSRPNKLCKARPSDEN